MSQGTPVASSRRASKKWPRWLVVGGWTGLGLLAIMGVLAFITLQFGAVHGVEFNPYTFARRSYSFYEIPLIRLQVRGIRREDVSSITEDFLSQQKYVAATQGAPDVWHVVLATRGTRKPRIGDADILVRYLDSQDHEDYHLWVKWSEQHPELAKIFWPVVGRLAQEEMYVFVPDLFDLARSAADPTPFQTKLNHLLAEKLFDLAGRLQAPEDQAQAKKLLDEAAQLKPEDPLIKRAREMAAAKSTPPQSPAKKP
jgi:hypothetical protein